MKKIFSLLFVLMLFSASAFADIRVPDIKRSPTPVPTATPAPKDVRMPFTIMVNPNFKEPTLMIPRSAVKALRAELAAIDGEGPAETVAASNFGLSKTQTLMSGMFLSLAIIFGGVWMARGKILGKNQKIVAGILFFAFFGVSAYSAFANAAPPAYRGIDGSLFTNAMQSHWHGATDQVKIEFTDSTYANAPIELYIPRDSKDGAKRSE